jgi:hypothetical protein
MADSPTKVRDVAWSELFPWLMLTRSVRVALLARVLVLGAAGLIATMIGWWLLAELFSRSTDPVITGWKHNTTLNIWNDSAETDMAPLSANTSARSAGEVFESARKNLLEAPVTIWLYFTRPFIEMFRSTLTPTGFLFLFLCGTWEVLVWGLFGGAITRIAALKFTRDEAPGIIAALRHAAMKWGSYSLPPLVALAGTAVFAVQLILLGFVMRLPILALVAAVFWPIVILLGLMMAVLLLGALVGWPLMWATVSVEGTDAFDALSRSYAYTYHRPWRLLWYVLFAAFLAIASMFVVKLFASSAIALGNWSIDWGLDNETMRSVVAPAPVPPGAANEGEPKIEVSSANPAPGEAASPPATPAPTTPPPPGELQGIPAATRTLIWFWEKVVVVVVAGYQAGFLWVAAVGIYLLLRRDIDGVQVSEVYIDQAEDYGMPPLTDDAATGVPEVAPREPALPGNTNPL